ncbi:histone deacetylase family protein [Roseomonas sp. SSH11]|uniref:Histone deacetylase family protein n=1 Tax=Pararoseomonas baculiformis TaxID=2820812 RepID=A0ABS4AAJ0_9PROT|nr:histone deacetylase family protein [Pararoseomonas baculiformis]MBP0444016.1 histone deacetylase family protein [Pararoseomonas baculiformis]
MQAFDHPLESAHAPQFFLMRGVLRPNFEVPARAASLREGLKALGIEPVLPALPARAALERVHAPDYLDWLRDGPAEWAAIPGAGAEIVSNIHPSPEMLAQGARPSTKAVGKAGWYTADTACPVGPGTWQAAEAAAGCALAAAGIAAKGGTAYALCRPPGHHAYAARAGGHCYVNNAAIAAQALRDAGATRVAVLDIDSHHGNGTQGIFWSRGDVLTVSVHADPDSYYPWFVGHAAETGAGDGAGFNLNLPQPMGTEDAGWLEAVAAGIARIRAFGADALVVSLGFDASEHEPLAALRVTSDGFARAGAAVAALGLPTAIIQEGGYNVEVIGGLLARFLGEWRG